MIPPKLTPGMIVTGMVCAVLFLIAACIFYDAGRLAMAKQVPVPENTDVLDYKKAHSDKLSAYAYLDAEKTKVALPIERAKALILKEGLPVIEMAAPGPGATPEEMGKAVFARLGCAACHSLEGKKVVGPHLNGAWGTERSLEGGGTVVMDLAYLTKSLYEPKADIAQGFQPLMNNFTGMVTEEEIASLAAYLESVK